MAASRYNREVVLGHTPALRAILQGEAPAAAAMVLVVSSVTLPCATPAAAAQQGGGPALEVSDGWYCVRAHVDEPLAELIAQGRIQVGLVGAARVISTWRPWVVGALGLSSRRQAPAAVLRAYKMPAMRDSAAEPGSV